MIAAGRHCSKTDESASKGNAMSVNIQASPDSSYAPDNNHTRNLAASLVAKSGPGVLYGLSGYNSGAAQFMQLHDSATVPANGVSPDEVIAIPATGNFSIDFGLYGKKFVNGIVICNSSTVATKTLGAADCFFAPRFK